MRSLAVLAEDLNEVSWSHTTRIFNDLAGTLDAHVRRGLSEAQALEAGLAYQD